MSFSGNGAGGVVTRFAIEHSSSVVRPSPTDDTAGGSPPHCAETSAEPPADQSSIE